MNIPQCTSVPQVDGLIEFYKLNGMPVPDELMKQRETLEAKEVANNSGTKHNILSDDCYVHSDTPIYDTLVKLSKFAPNEEKTKCIKETVDYLLQDTPDATQPGLLLGKIQSGKTDTFVKIMALAMDKCIDTCVVFTKGTNALSEQTVLRMEDDFKPFEYDESTISKPVVSIYDIMDIKYTGLTKKEVNNHKNIIICKKEDDNLKHLLKLFNQLQPLLKEKKILVIDDEADFASWNYMKRGGSIQLAVITKLINEFINTPKYCRYLQVTATPYSLYLQPDMTIQTEEDGCIRPMKPRFTTIVPTHPKYVGGDEYFSLSKNPDSMYSYLFHEISETCMRALKVKNSRYLNNMLTSKNLYGFRYAIFSYLIATIIRKIQENGKKDYCSSCLIHLDVTTTKHVWQEDLVKDLINKIKKAYTTGNTEYLDEMFDDIYEDFRLSNEAARTEFDSIKVEMPSKERVKSELINAIDEIEADDVVHVVNSEHGVKELLNKRTGQLKLKALFNIFIGGSILDRGITIDKMLCFFYGRTTNTYQQDTVLQHMRQYGSRDKEDIAVTRLHTTEGLYVIMNKMNEMDNQLRAWLISKDNDSDMKAVFVAAAPGTGIVPCAKKKIIVSNTVTIKPSFRQVVSGFQTGPKSTISKIINSIDHILQSQPGYVENDFFLISKTIVIDILHKIRSTYIYDDEPGRQWNNYGYDWNEMDMIGSIIYCTQNQSQMYCLIRTNMDASRIRLNGNFTTAPDTGRTDLSQARAIAIDKPVIMLFRENGLVEQGWRGTPFYWPVFVGQQNIIPAIFTADARVPEIQEIECDTSELLEGIAPDEVIKLRVKSDTLMSIMDGKVKELYKVISDTDSKLYLQQDILGNLMINPAIEEITDETFSAGIHSYNNGIFPFVIKPLKYLLLWNRISDAFLFVLVKLNAKQPFELFVSEDGDEDVLRYPNGEEEEIVYDNYVNWCLHFKFKMDKYQAFSFNGENGKQ